MYLLLLLLFSIQFKHHFFWIILGAVGCLLHGHLTVPYTTCILIACQPFPLDDKLQEDRDKVSFTHCYILIILKKPWHAVGIQ